MHRYLQDRVQAAAAYMCAHPNGGLFVVCLDNVSGAAKEALRDVFVTTSVRYADPRIGLLEGEAWEGTRPFICRSLGLPASAKELRTSYRRVRRFLPTL